MINIFCPILAEFAKFRASRAFVSSCLRALCPSCLRVLRTLFVRVKIVLDGFVVQQKFSIFQGLLQALATNRAVFKWAKKQPWNLLSGEMF